VFRFWILLLLYMHLPLQSLLPLLLCVKVTMDKEATWEFFWCAFCLHTCSNSIYKEKEIFLNLLIWIILNW
jgi:hypothetical protein